MRGALSAILDGASAGPHGDAALAHLESCDACRAWLRDARTVDRRVRTAPSVPDLTARVLAAVRADPSRAASGQTVADRPASAWWVRALRLVLAVSALVQVLSAVPILVAAGGPDEAVHTSREMAAFDLAVAAAFLFVAWRPRRAAANLPLAVVLATCLAAVGVLDVVTNHTGALHELGHLLTVAQAGVLALLARAVRRPRPPSREASRPMRIAA